MPRTEAEIVNKLGLHARAAAKLTQLAGNFAAEVWLLRNGRRVNAKSIMGVMMLAAGKGSRVVIEADGEDADSALGAGVSGGIAIGHAHLVSTARLEVAHYEIAPQEIEAEIARFDRAIAQVRG